jgi:hypothetical protein
MYYFDRNETLRRAQNLIGEGTPDALRYACLELRFCIESICYEKLKLYEKHVPKKVYETWQPRKVIEILQEYDPYVLEDYEISFWSEKPDGTPDKFILGEKHTNLRFEILKKHYYKLGNYLHAPTLSQQKNDLTGRQDLKAYLQSILPNISAAALNTFNGNIAMVAHFNCKECGHYIVRNIESLKKNPVAICTNENCNAEYDVIVNGENTSWKLRELDYDCPNCKKKNYFGIHHLKDGQVLKCFSCSTRYGLFRNWHIKELTENKT